MTISIRSPHARGDPRRVVTAPLRRNFNPLPSCEGRQESRNPKKCLSIFQSTPLIRGETFQPFAVKQRPEISIRSPHARGDTSRDSLRSRRSNFNPLPSHEGRPRPSAPGATPASYFNPLPSHEGRPTRFLLVSPQNNFNPLPSHEGRRATLGLPQDCHNISIHSPHTRGDQPQKRRSADGQHFNPLPSHEGRPRLDTLISPIIGISIHSPHTRGDSTRAPQAASHRSFQSTPLTRGETRQRQRPKPASRFQSTPLTRGETTVGSASPGARLFQSTPLTRGETLTLQVYSHITVISIHSPHTRGDDGSAGTGTGRLISIHSPHTRGDSGGVKPSRCMRSFQSTPLTRGETIWDESRGTSVEISIHSPHTRGDQSYFSRLRGLRISIHSPHTRGDLECPQPPCTVLFQSTPLIRGETRKRSPSRRWSSYFNPLPSYEGRLSAGVPLQCLQVFQSTPLIRGETRPRAENFQFK